MRATDVLQGLLISFAMLLAQRQPHKQGEKTPEHQFAGLAERHFTRRILHVDHAERIARTGQADRSLLVEAIDRICSTLDAI